MVLPLFVVILLTMEYGFRSYVYEGDIRKAHEFAPLLEADFVKAGSWRAVEPLLTQPPFAEQSVPNQALGRIQERIVVLNMERRVVLDSKKVLVGTLHPPEHLLKAIKLTTKQGKQIGYLLVGTMVDPALTSNHKAFLADMAIMLLILFMASLALSLPLAFWLGSRISRPLKLLVEETQRSTSGHWAWQVPSQAPREVQSLALAFQTLGQNLKASELRKAELLADAAHELRTPLTVMRGSLEAMIEGVFPLEKATLEAVYSETLRLEKIVDSLRLLEDLRLTQVKSSRFIWLKLVAHVVELFKVPSFEKKQEIVVNCSSVLEGWGEIEAVTQVLINLVSNSLRYAPEGGHVWLQVKHLEKGSMLQVENDGPPIPATERDHIFERFVRLDRSRSGQTGGRGLGLAITREIVSRHAGNIRVLEGSHGGPCFEVFFPGPQKATNGIHFSP